MVRGESGTISIGGRVVNELPTKDRNLAMVFQNYALYQHMTVYDNLAFGQQQRVALGRCIVRHPQVFLVDLGYSPGDTQALIEAKVVFAPS